MIQKQNSISTKLPLPPELIKRRIYVIRGREAMLDSDLAELYQVPTKRLNESVRRNKDRFPQDFMFQLDKKEEESLRFQIETSSGNSLRSQNATLETGRGKYSKYAAHAFTEHGIVMLSSVLNSRRAIAMNIFIIRAFIQLRKMLIEHKELSNRLQKAEKVIRLHDQVLIGVVEDIKRIKNPPKINLIGFHWKPKTI
jgi:hypothetical protein